MRPRLITHFVSADDAQTIMFPKSAYEWESSQGLRTALESAVGMDYAVDLHGLLPAPKGEAQERLRGLVVAADGAALDSEIASLRSQLYAFGRGRLWATDANGVAHWAWARLSDMPDLTLTFETRRHAPLIASFVRLSDWFAEEPTVIVEELAGSPATVAVVNDGTAPARNITFVLAAKAAGGFNQPQVSNALTGESWRSTRVAASGTERLRVDTGRYSVERSTDNGSSWSNDYALFSTGVTQVGFMRFVPGGQNLTITGAANATLTVMFYPAFD